MCGSPATLLGPVGDFLDFDSQLANGDTVPYTIEQAGQKETGVGTFSTTGPTITRTAVGFSTSGYGVPVPFGAGTKNIYSGLPGDLVQSVIDPGASDGFLAQIAANVFSRRTLTADNGLTIADGDGVAGNPLISGTYKRESEFGADPSPGFDNVTAFAAMVSYAIGAANPALIVLTAGIYEYSVSPNWAVANLTLICHGDVRFRYTGTGNAVIIDGGATGGGVFNVRMGRIYVEAPASASNGVYMRAVHHGVFDFNVRGCGSAASAILTNWCVLNEIRFVCSGNEEGGFYLSAKPAFGIVEDDRTGSKSAYNYWPNAIVEACATGIYLDGCVGTQFVGGTSEGNTTIGLVMTADASLNIIRGMDLEANAGGLPSGYDIEISGSQNVIEHVASDSMLRVKSGARFNRISNSMLFNLEIESGAVLTVVGDTTYDRHGVTVGTFVDNGTDTMISNLISTRTAEVIKKAGISAYNSLDWAAETVSGPTTHTYTNNTEYDQVAVVSGGLITNFIYGRAGGGGNFVTMPAGEAAAGAWPLSPGDSIQITFTSGWPPSVIIWNK
jgi:hypothetical protein